MHKGLSVTNGFLEKVSNSQITFAYTWKSQQTNGHKNNRELSC